MRVIILANACWVLFLVACTKHNSDLCCNDASDCSVVGLSSVTACSDGLVCRGNQCIAEVCSGAADCDAAAPFCDNTTASCVEQCTTDSQCPGLGDSSNDPFCIAGACVQCRMGMNDCAGTTPICDANACRGCMANPECASGLCNMGTGACVDASTLLYASPGGADTAACTEADPCSLAHAITSVTSTLNTILMASGTYGATITINSGATMTLLGNNSTLDQRLTVSNGSHVTAQDLTLNGVWCYDTTTAPNAALNLTRGTINVDPTPGFPARLGHCHLTLSQVSWAYGIMFFDNASLSADRSSMSGFDVSSASMAQLQLTNSIFGGMSFPDTGSHQITVDVSFSTLVYDSSGNTDLVCPNPTVAGVAVHFSNVIAFSPIAGINPTPSVDGCFDHVISFPLFGTKFTGVTYVDPKLVDPAHGDYHLMPGSPAIDAADTTIPDDHDFDGTARPQGAGPDIGAFEFH
jgi:hypothetical protein